MSADRQRAQLELLKKLSPAAGEPEFDARLDSFETAFRMQSAAPEVFALDEAFRILYSDPALDFRHLAKFDLAARRV